MIRNPYTLSLQYGATIALTVGVLLVAFSLTRQFQTMILPETSGVIIPWLWFGSGFIALGFAQLTCWQTVNALRWRSSTEADRGGVP